MKITFPNKQQAKEQIENALRCATKYSWDINIDSSKTVPMRKEEKEDYKKRLSFLKEICQLKN